LKIKESEILRNKRPSFMQNKELDLWLPEYKYAIEFHGLAHHSERTVFYKNSAGYDIFPEVFLATAITSTSVPAFSPDLRR
jgi:hypothetical protein